ncbi:uncharacterized protein LOC135201669 [Macrobrachium nipponense]|uniref:uncharacterized protein LOC135201669 n=1 Tax=Macrobrachium nipponense TaxID=159736 RepID=UPI0030C8543F
MVPLSGERSVPQSPRTNRADMWSSVVFVLLVASVRADADADPVADADADAEPFVPYVYPQFNFGNNWAAVHFAQPHEILDTKVAKPEEDATHRPSFGFTPVAVAHNPLLAIRDVQAPTASILQLRKPGESHDVQVLRQPAMVFGPPLFFQTSHIRVPDHDQKEPTPVPVAVAPSSIPFASQHTAQVSPIVPFPSFTTFIGNIPLHVPLTAPSYAIQHSAQVPIIPSAILHKVSDDDDDDDEDDDDNELNIVYVRHFPTQLASLPNLRVAGNEQVIPAGIVQSTQPIIKPVAFKNSKAHPDLLGKVQNTRSAGVIAA